MLLEVGGVVCVPDPHTNHTEAASKQEFVWHVHITTVDIVNVAYTV